MKLIKSFLNLRHAQNFSSKLSIAGFKNRLGRESSGACRGIGIVCTVVTEDDIQQDYLRDCWGMYEWEDRKIVRKSRSIANSAFRRG